MTSNKAILLTLFCSVLAAFGQTFFKIGAASIGKNLYSWLSNWQLILGMFIYALSALLFVVALKHGNLSILYPIIAMSYVWITLISKFFFKEPVNIFNWLGILLITGGVFVISFKGGFN